MGWRKKTKNSWEYTRSTAAFSATLHAARREVQVCTLIIHGEHLTEYRLLTARALVQIPSLLDLRWFLGAAHPTTPAAGAELPSPPQQLLSIPCKSAAPVAIAQLLQLQKPSHNYCCSGGHRVTAPATAIAPASSSLSISDSFSKFATSSLIECYSLYLQIVVGRALFIVVAN